MFQLSNQTKSLAKHPDSQHFYLLTAPYPKQSADTLNVQAQAGGPESCEESCAEHSQCQQGSGSWLMPWAPGQLVSASQCTCAWPQASHAMWLRVSWQKAHDSKEWEERVNQDEKHWKATLSVSTVLKSKKIWEWQYCFMDSEAVKEFTSALKKGCFLLKMSQVI